MSTFSAKKKEVDRKWWVLDLDQKVLGRAATRIASILKGKNKAIFTPHVDTGDFIVAINASKMLLTGKKLEQKKYYRHSGYPGGIKEVSAGQLMETKPQDVLSKAVAGMLPKNILGRQLLKKLKIYAGGEHPHSAQKPEELKL